MISPCYNSYSAKTVNLKKWVAEITLIEKEPFIEWMAATGIAS